MSKLMMVLAIVVVGCSTSGGDVCDAFNAKCPSGSVSGDAGGPSATVTVACKPDAVDEASNKSDVKDCIEKAADCAGAIVCMATLKK